MNRNETIIILAYLRECFPQGKAATETTVDVWADLFRDYHPDVVKEAARIAASTWEGYTMPPPSVLLKIIREMQPTDMTGIELWRIAERAIRKGTVLTNEEWHALPEPVKRYFGGKSAIRDLAMLDMDQLPNERARFLRAIDTIAERDRIQQQLPENVRGMLGMLDGPLLTDY